MKSSPSRKTPTRTLKKNRPSRKNQDDETLAFMRRWLLEVLNAKKFTREDLMKRNQAGSTIAHLAATNEQALRKIKPLLTPEILGTTDKDGRNVAHIAAANGHLCLIAGKLTLAVEYARDRFGKTPINLALAHIKPVLTKELLFQESEDGYSLFSLLIPHRLLVEVADLLTPDMLFDESQPLLRIGIFSMIRKENIPAIRHLITRETLFVRERGSPTLLEYLMSHDALDQIIEFITPELLKAKGIVRGGTLLHVAASDGQLRHIKHLLRPEDLMLRTERGWSVAHWAMMAGGTVETLVDLFTPEVLAEKDDQGVNVVHVAATKGHLAQIACKLTANLVCATDAKGKTPIDLALECDRADIEANLQKFPEDVRAQFVAQMIERLSRPAA